MKSKLSRWILSSGVVGISALVGCRDNSPPPPRVPVPTSERPERRAAMTEMKPLPPERPDENYARPPFDDVPLVTQQVPEQPAFLDAYRRVGQPRIVLFVNRTLEGNILPVNQNDPLVSVERTRKSSTGVDVETRDTVSRDSRYRTQTAESSDRFKSTGPAEYRETTDVYLRPGQYDEVAAKSLDYEAVENIMTDVLACDGQVTIISPTMARQRLSDQQVKELQEGRPQVMSEIVQQLGADILVQVQAHPTRQTRQGLEVRIIAEALNIKGGQSIGRAVVDLPPPLEKKTINRYTRFMGRKLMYGMTGSWLAPAPAGGAAPAPAPAPASPPAPPAPAPAPAPAAPIAPPAQPAPEVPQAQP